MSNFKTWTQENLAQFAEEANVKMTEQNERIEQLQREGLPIQPFTTTHGSKMMVIDALALAFERAEIGLPDVPWLIAELEAYEAARTPTGLVRYGAPDGLHDDGVMSLALAWHAATAGQVTYTEALY